MCLIESKCKRAFLNSDFRVQCSSFRESNVCGERERATIICTVGFDCCGCSKMARSFMNASENIPQSSTNGQCYSYFICRKIELLKC